MTTVVADLGDLYYSRLFKGGGESGLIIKPLFTIPEKVRPMGSLTPQGGTGPKGGKGQDDLYFALRFFLRFGRILGIIPLSGIFGTRWSDKLEFRSQSFPAFQSLAASFMLLVNALVGAYNLIRWNKQTASDVAFQSAMVIFYSTGLFIYIYFFRNAEALIQLFAKWRNLKKLTYCPDIETPSLPAKSALIAVTIFASAVLENMLLFLLQAQVITFPPEHPQAGALFKVYYITSHQEWHVFCDPAGPASEALGIFLFIANKLGLYAWNFADILVLLFSRALAFKFKGLNDAGRRTLVRADEPSNDPQAWRALTLDFSTLTDLLDEFALFLSPLVFGCYAVNVYFICIQIKKGLTPSANVNWVYAMYTVWSFLHLIFRVFLVSLSAARINENVQGIRRLLQLCPSVAYVAEVKRADYRIATTDIGLNGLGCFVITKPFLLTIVGVVFTLEIVLLQTV